MLLKDNILNKKTKQKVIHANTLKWISSRMLMPSVCLLGVGIAQELALLRISHRPRKYEGPWIALMSVLKHLESITAVPSSNWFSLL